MGLIHFLMTLGVITTGGGSGGEDDFTWGSENHLMGDEDRFMGDE